MKKIIKIGNLKIGEGIPKICVPIVSTMRTEILKAAKEIKSSKADFVEWRADYFESINNWEEVEIVLKDIKKILGDMPLLFTVRTKKDGGNLDIAPQEYYNLNSNVIKSGLVSLIDIEFFFSENIVKTLIEQAKKFKVYTVVSNHDFETTPEKSELIRRMCAMHKVNGDILKIAVMPKNKKDVLNLLEATEEMTRVYADRPIITMSMSALGTVSRCTGEVFGSAVTFGTLGRQSAPGQIPVEELKVILKVLHDNSIE